MSAQYDWFRTFVNDHFGAEKDALYYTFLGSTLAFVAAGDWVRPSYTSASIGFATSLPAKTRVEYWTGANPHSFTALTESHYFNHLHFITGLAQSTLYNYTLHATDERLNAITQTGGTFTTGSLTGKVLVPNDIGGSPPYTLSTAGATYVLTQNIIANGKAILFLSNSGTLDLDGFTITYNQVFDATLAGNDSIFYTNNSPIGIRLSSASENGKIYNGTIIQGLGNNEAEPQTNVGTSPVFGTGGPAGVEIAGLRLKWEGTSVQGMLIKDGGNNLNVHHCLFEDHGNTVVNRHFQHSSLKIGIGNTGQTIHHNLIKRCRQCGIVGVGGACDDNEVQGDSFTTNSLMIYQPTVGGTAHRNRIFGTGYHVIGLAWSPHADNNLIHFFGIPAGGRETEFGIFTTMVGIRTTLFEGEGFARDNWDYDTNLIIIKTEGFANECRGVQLSTGDSVTNQTLRNSTIKVIRGDSQGIADKISCICTQGQVSPFGCTSHKPVFYRTNTLITNHCFIRFGDYYQAPGCNAEWYNMTFTKDLTGFGTDYRFIRSGSLALPQDARGNKIYSSVFGSGVDRNDILYESAGVREYFIGWKLTVNTNAGLMVEIKDLGGVVVASGLANGSGVFTANLFEFSMNYNLVKSMKTPHTVTVQNFLPVSVTMDADKSINVSTPAPIPQTVVVALN